MWIVNCAWVWVCKCVKIQTIRLQPPSVAPYMKFVRFTNEKYMLKIPVSCFPEKDCVRVQRNDWHHWIHCIQNGPGVRIEFRCMSMSTITNLNWNRVLVVVAQLFVNLVLTRKCVAVGNKKKESRRTHNMDGMTYTYTHSALVLTHFGCFMLNFCFCFCSFPPCCHSYGAYNLCTRYKRLLKNAD